MPSTTAVPTTVAPGTLAPAASGRVFGYVPWYTDPATLGSIPPTAVTHLVYAFLAYDAVTGKLGPRSDDTNFDRNYGALRQLKAANPNLHLIAGIGGAGGYSSYFPAVVASDGTRDAAASSTVAFLRAHPAFDGIDLDWESPASAVERTRLTSFVQTLRGSLATLSASNSTAYSISLAVGVITDCGNVPTICIDGLFDIAGLAPHVDMWNLMTYSLTGAWVEATQHHAPLVARPDVDSFARDQTDGFENSGEHAVAAYLARGIPASRLNLGVPFYGAQFCGVPAGANDGIFERWERGINAPYGCLGDGQINYRIIQTDFTAAKGWRDHYDAIAKASWRYNPSERKLLTYESPQSLAAKRDWARQLGLGGFMIWEMGADTADWQLLRTLNS